MSWLFGSLLLGTGTFNWLGCSGALVCRAAVLAAFCELPATAAFQGAGLLTDACGMAEASFSWENGGKLILIPGEAIIVGYQYGVFAVNRIHLKV